MLFHRGQSVLPPWQGDTGWLSLIVWLQMKVVHHILSSFSTWVRVGIESAQDCIFSLDSGLLILIFITVLQVVSSTAFH